MNRIGYDDYEVGFELPSLSVGPIKQMDLVRYAGASGDFNPIHNDVNFAKSVGLDGTIVHGMYVMAQLGRVWSNWVTPAQVREFGAKFKGITKPGETLTCTGKIKRKKEKDGEKLIILDLQATGNNGDIKAAADVVIVCE